ncbi:hypothetical protein O3P69_017865 [Scylla paramamosain]|uniref:Uncharacterized protein n=1 Tax=Scylla paramamosain TaxID=85552 RepID=A0AAW0TH63_SCYPA
MSQPRYTKLSSASALRTPASSKPPRGPRPSLRWCGRRRVLVTMASLTPLLFTKRMCPPGRDPSRDPGVSTPLQVMSSEDGASISSVELTLPHIAREVLRRKALGHGHVEPTPGERHWGRGTSVVTVVCWTGTPCLALLAEIEANRIRISCLLQYLLPYRYRDTRRRTSVIVQEHLALSRCPRSK